MHYTNRPALVIRAAQVQGARVPESVLALHATRVELCGVDAVRAAQIPPCAELTAPALVESLSSAVADNARLAARHALALLKTLPTDSARARFVLLPPTVFRVEVAK